MAYDTNGNLTKDLDRDIVTIKYNLLNLPEIIQFKNGNQIRNKYNAAGQKLSSRNITVDAGVYQPLNPGDIILNIDVNENDNVTVEGMDYLGNIEYQIYRFFDWDVTFEPVEYKYLSKIHNPEGYATSATTSNGPVYYYYRRDHLGNNRELWRASYTWGSTTHPAATVQRTQYYPSGLPWKYNSGDNPGSQPYKYNGKEFVEMHGLDEYDSEARWYYPAIMRTTTMDPHCESYYDTSPYVWCANNPVRMVDPDGKDVWEINSKGEIVWKEKSEMHRLYSLNRDGSRNETNFVEINDRSVLDGLTATGKESDYTVSYAHGDPTDLASIFLFASDNSNAEWRFSRYNTGNGDQYAVGTAHNSGLAITTKQMGYSLESEIAFIHSHPTQYKATSAELESMGWKSQGQIYRPSDSFNAHSQSDRFQAYKNSYVYFPHTKNIYHVRGSNQPALIRTLSNHRNNGQRLFWGTLNHK
jgi:RHS repeat-associated protein